MSGKFAVPAGKHTTCRLVICDNQAACYRLDAPVSRLAIRDTVPATVEVVSGSAAAISAAVRRAPERSSSYIPPQEHSFTYKHHSALVLTG